MPAETWIASSPTPAAGGRVAAMEPTPLRRWIGFALFGLVVAGGSLAVFVGLLGAFVLRSCGC